jgi:hypothetical protein
VRDSGDHVAVQRHPQPDLVAAGRVHVMHLDVIRLREARMVRVAVVVQDDLLVQRV